MDRFGRWIFGVGVAGVAVYALLSYNEWPGQWQWTIDAATGTTVLTGPLVGALAAGLQLSSSSIEDLVRPSPRSWLVPYRAASQAWAVGSVVYIATCLGVMLVTLRYPHGGSFDWWALAMGFIVLAVCAFAGVAITYWLPNRVTVLAAAPLIFLLGTYGPRPLPGILRHGPSTGTLAGLRIDPDVFAAHACAGLSLALCLAVTVLPWRQRGSQLRRAVSAVLAVGLFVGGSVGVGIVGNERWKPSGERPIVCVDGYPTVCVSPSSKRYLHVTASAIQEQARILVSTGINIPGVYDEELPRVGDPGHGTFILQRAEELSPRDAVAMLTRPSPCPAWSDPEGPPPSAAFDAEYLLVEWAVAKQGEEPFGSGPDMDRWLGQVPSAETDAWARRTFAQLRACDLDEIGMPWDGN